MKLLQTFLFICLVLITYLQNNYSIHFTNESMRVDFMVAGNAKTEKFFYIKKWNKVVDFIPFFVCYQFGYSFLMCFWAIK